jgi:excisionase family DNA binding protein
MNTEKERWIKLDEAAKYLSVSRGYLYQKGPVVGIPRVKLGSDYRYRMSDLDAWLLGKLDAQDS